MGKKNLLIICGGQSPEHEISLISAKNVIKAVNKDKYEIFIVGIAKDGAWYYINKADFLSLSDNPKEICFPIDKKQRVFISSCDNQGFLYFTEHTSSLSEANRVPIHIAFPVLHGENGEDGSIQGLLQVFNVPYVGCDVLSSAICMDKAVSKQILNAASIPVAKAITIQVKPNENELKRIVSKLGLPIFVKPATLGSSVGISKVKKEQDLLPAIKYAMEYDKKVLLEENISGREIECAVLGSREGGGIKASLPGEIIPNAEFYSYEAKYIDEEGAVLKVPAELTDSQIKNIQSLAVKTYETLFCKGMARVDFFMRQDDSLIVNEVNTIPGFTKISMYPKLWELTGLSYSELVEKLISDSIFGELNIL